MNTRFLALAAVILPSDPGTAWKAVADRLHSTVIEVQGLQAHETIRHGTGVLIGNGLAITTLHAVALPSASGRMAPLQEVKVLLPDAGSMDAQVIAGAPDLDLAILRLPDQAASLEGATLASFVPVEGDRLVAMGAGDDAITAIGVVVSAVDGDLFALASKRMIDSRFWGGPLFDADGRLAGIQLTSLSGSRAISALAIQRLLDQRAVIPGSPVPP
jgi:S1-C subfamily serine protease